MTTREFVKSDNSAHWYTPAGEPQHDADLREARKKHLLPSVTSILRILDKPAIADWKANTMLQCAFTANYSPDASIDEKVQATIADYEEEMDRGKGIGSEIHHMIESYLQLQEVAGTYSADAWTVFREVQRWIDENINTETAVSEFIYANRTHGYAGTVDCIAELKDGRIALIDWKTQFVKEGKPQKRDPSKRYKTNIKFYSEWKTQLAAYSRCSHDMIRRDFDVVMSVGISSNPNNLMVQAKEYDTEAIQDELVTFDLVHAVYRRLKNLPYDAEAAQVMAAIMSA
jgi:hypothetical protein